MGDFSQWAHVPTDWKFWIGIIGGIVSLAAYVPYIISILWGATRPSRTTWWILSCVVLITLVTYHSSGAGNTLWMVVGDLIGVLSIAILSIWYGHGGGEWIDFASLIGAIIALVMYLAFSSPIIAMATLLAVDFLAMMPTWIKTYDSPRSEDWFAWFLTTLGHTVSMFAVERWIFAIIAYPIYHSIASGLVVLLALRKT